MIPIATGLDRLLQQPPPEVSGARIGLLTNPSGIDRNLRSTVDLVTGHEALEVTALYGPEHGVRGEAQAGEHVEGGIDSRTGLPVFSLYGATRTPTQAMLDAFDVMIIDMQDIGARFTTYISSVAHLIDACDAAEKGVVILDRPNPLGGGVVAGNLLDPAFASFVGIHRIPIRHGLTIGEFGRLWARDHGRTDPVVMTMNGWSRDMWYDQTGLPWVPPSPNLPTLDSVIAFPATCLIEGTNLSEGRGTTRPFEWIGAPWIDPPDLVDALHGLGLDGVMFRPVSFTPSFSKHAGTRCGGIQIHVHDREAFDAVGLGPHLLATFKRLYPQHFAWLEPHEGRYFIDLLAGGSTLRETIDSGEPVDSLLATWLGEAAAFRRDRSDILLYD